MVARTQFTHQKMQVGKMGGNMLGLEGPAYPPIREMKSWLPMTTWL